MCVCRLSYSFRGSSGSSIMDLMMRLLIISASHGSCSSGRFDYGRLSGRALASNEKVVSSCPHVVDMTEDVLATEKVTALPYK